MSKWFSEIIMILEGDVTMAQVHRSIEKDFNVTQIGSTSGKMILEIKRKPKPLEFSHVTAEELEGLPND